MNINETENEKNNKRPNLRRNLRTKLAELENEREEEENLVSPRSARSVHSNKSATESTTHIAKDSARSDQRLIINEEDENSKKEAKKKLKRNDKLIKEKNIDDGKINKAYESDTNLESKSNEQTETLNEKPPVKRTRKPRKKVDLLSDKKNDDHLINDSSNILAVTIHQTDKLRTDVNIYNPVVRVHLLDLDSDGQYVKKTKKDRHTLCYYEKENRKLDYISPIMTTPFDFKKSRTILPRWEEILVFNEEFSHFIKNQPNVLIMFELLDMHKANLDQNSHQQTYTSQDTSKDWQRIAWCFLKLVGQNKSFNIEKKIRLQLYYTQTKYKFNLVESLVPEVYNLYKNGPKVKYPASLHVTVKSIRPPNQFFPGVGSSDLVTQEYLSKIFLSNVYNSERLSQKSEQSLRRLDDDSEQLVSDDLMIKKNTIIWSRLAGLPCRVPNDLALKLNPSKKGCYSIKFSITGSFLACGCIEDESTFPIYIYQIPDGRLNMKFYGHFGLVYDLSWSKLDKYLVTASNDATARVIDIESKSKDAYKILPHPSFLYTAKFHPNSLDIICTAGYDKVIRVWSIDNKKKKFQKYGELLHELYDHSGYINTICFSIDGSCLYSADSAGQIKAWSCNIETDLKNKNEWSLKENIFVDELKNQSIHFMQLLPNQFRMLIQLRDNQLKVIDIRLKSVVQRFKGTYNFSHNLKSTISPCGTFLFNCGSDTKIYCWNINTGDQLETASINLNYLKPARDIDFHPFDNLIAFCSYDTNAPVYVFKYNSEKAALNIGKINILSARAEPLNLQKTMDQSFLNDEPEKEEENELEKRLKEDMEKFKEFQANRWKMVQEKLDSVYPERSSLSARSDPTKTNVISSITLSMPDHNKKPEFKYRGPKEAHDIVISLYDYKAQRGDELDLAKGDEILVLVRENDNWWMGELLRNKREGYFPANYVQDKAELENLKKKNAISQIKMPKYSVRDAMAEYEKVYEPNILNKQDNKQSQLNTVDVDKTNAVNKKDKKSIMTINNNNTRLNEKNNYSMTNFKKNNEIINETKIEEIHEVPTKDDSSEKRVKKRDGTKRRTFAHEIIGSHLTSSDV